MSSRQRNRIFPLGFVALATILAASANATVLPVQLVTQEQNQWCWAATSKCVINYYGSNVDQCQIAEFTRTHVTWHNFGPVNCCTDPSQGCNYWNYLSGGGGSIQDILAHWGLSSSILIREMYLSEVSTTINDNRPFILRWGWTSGGGHFVVGHGVEGNNLYIMDPWYGEGFKVASYEWVVSGSNHTWTHTAVVTTPFPTASFHMRIEATEGGTTSPPPGTHSYLQNARITITALPAPYYQLLHWSGDASGTSASVTVIMTGDKIVRAHFGMIYAPVNAKGEKILNRSLSQAEYINVLTWEANPQNVNIAQYRIYVQEGPDWKLLAAVEATKTQYLHRGVPKDSSLRYRIAAVSAAGDEGLPAFLIVS